MHAPEGERTFLILITETHAGIISPLMHGQTHNFWIKLSGLGDHGNRTSVRNRRNWWEVIFSFSFLFFIPDTRCAASKRRAPQSLTRQLFKRMPSSGPLSRPLFPRWILIIPLKVAPALAASGPDTHEPSFSYLSQLVIPIADYSDS